MNNHLSSKERRNRNLALKQAAKDKAKAAGLDWDDSIPAAQFFDNPEQAYTNATTSSKAAPIADIPPVVLPGLPKSDATPTESSSTAELLAAAKAAILPTAEVSPDLPEDETRNGEPPAAETVTEKPLSKKERKALKYAEKQAKREANQAKAEQALATAATETPATEKKVLGTSAGDLGKGGYDSTNDPAPVQHALMDAEEETHVCEELVRESEEADAKKKAKEAKDEPATETPAPEPVQQDDPVTETPVVESEQKPAAEEVVPVVEPPQQETQPEPVAEPEKQPEPVVAAATPKLTLVSDNPNDPKLAAAKAFYGEACTPSRAKLLAEALVWLNKAIVFEKAGEKTKTEMAFKAALKKEAEAFSDAVALAA